MTTRYLFEEALLPDGWARNVGLAIERGAFTEVVRDAPPAFAPLLRGCALPGMPNLHSHLFQRAMAGLAERRGPGADSFWSWREVMYGFLLRLGPEDVEAIAAMAMVEMLEGGFTALAEFHYLHHAPDGSSYADPAEMAARIGAAASDTGIGLTLLPVFYAHGGFGAQPPGPAQRRFVNDLDGFAALLEGTARAIAPVEGAQLGVAPHSLRAATGTQIAALLAMKAGGPVHIHVAEQVAEVEACLGWCGERPVQHLLRTQEVDGRWCLIHATHMMPAETADLAASGAVAGLCPITEANLGDGFFPMLAYDGAWGIGSDSNVEITAPGELRLLEYGQRLLHRGRNLLARTEGRSTGEAMYLQALAGGAQACGRAIGRIEPGARADLVLLEAGRSLDDYVFVRPGLLDVMVGGVFRVRGGRHVARDAVAARFAHVMARLRG
jgi:formiminoglutamate deiminase